MLVTPALTDLRPVAPVNVTFRDEFVEGSPPVNLSSHTPNVGTAWTDQGTNVWKINPSGEAFLTAPQLSNLYCTRATPDLASTTIYLEFTILPVDLLGAPLICFGNDFSQAGQTSLNFQWNTTVAAGVVTLSGFLSAAFQFSDTLETLAGAIGVPHTLRLELRPNEQKYYRDGSLVKTNTRDLSAFTGVKHGLQERSGLTESSTAGAHITHYQVGTL